MPQNFSNQIKIMIGKKILGVLFSLIVALIFTSPAAMSAGLCREALSLSSRSEALPSDLGTTEHDTDLTKELKELSRTVAEIEKNPAADLENKDFNQILSKILRHPNSKLSVQELSFLKLNKNQFQIIRSVQGLVQASQKTASLLRTALLYWDGHLSTTSFYKEKTWNFYQRIFLI